MPITAKCLIPAIGMLLKHIFRGSQKNKKNATFLVLYSAKRICEKYKMAAEYNFKNRHSGTSIKRDLSNDVTLDPPYLAGLSL